MNLSGFLELARHGLTHAAHSWKSVLPSYNPKSRDGIAFETQSGKATTLFRPCAAEHRRLMLLDEYEFRFFDEAACQIVTLEELLPSDLHLWELNVRSLARWVAKRLNLPPCQEKAPVSGLAVVSIDPRRVYLSVAPQAATLVQHLEQIVRAHGEQAIVISISAWTQSEVVQDFLQRNSPLAVERFDEIFTQAADGSVEVNPPLSLDDSRFSLPAESGLNFPPPKGCDWEDLHLEIETYDTQGKNNEDMAKDRLHACYKRNGGIICRMNPIDLMRLPAFTRGRYPNNVWMLLRRYAKAQGVLVSALTEQQRNIDNENRKKLRQALIALFGYPSSSKPFLRQGSGSKARFKIKFKDRMAVLYHDIT